MSELPANTVAQNHCVHSEPLEPNPKDTANSISRYKGADLCTNMLTITGCLQVPDRYRAILDGTESIPWRRRDYEKHAFFRELLERAEECSSFKYTSHLRRHERGIKMIQAQKSQKSFSESKFFSELGSLGDDKYSQRWIFRVKVIFILFIFYASYKTFQIARDDLRNAGGQNWVDGT